MVLYVDGENSLQPQGATPKTETPLYAIQNGTSCGTDVCHSQGRSLQLTSNQEHHEEDTVPLRAD